MAKLFSERVAQYSLWALWFLLIATSILWLLVGSVAYWMRKGWLPADSAGWAQAVGAFLAIVVAIALPYFQARQHRIDRIQESVNERLNGINATYALMSHMEGLYERLDDYSTPLASVFGNHIRGSKNDSLLHELNQAAAMLREIPVTAISNQMVHFIIGLREVANYGEFMSATLSAPLSHPSTLYDIRRKSSANHALIVRWKEELDVLEEDIRATMR